MSKQTVVPIVVMLTDSLQTIKKHWEYDSNTDYNKNQIFKGKR